MKQKQESVHNSTREIDHIQTSATVSYMCDGKSHNLLQDTTKRSKHSSTKVRYPHIGAKTVSLNLPAAEDKENDEVMQEDYDVAITHKQQCSEDEDDIDVTNFFGFRTPKRSKLSGKTPLKEQSETPATPSTNKRRARKLKLKSSTPSRLVARMTLDESVDDSTDSEGSEGSDDVPPDSFPSTICSSQQLPSLAEDFFHAQSQKQITSNHTLAKLREEGVLDQTSLKDILSTKCCQYGEGRQFLMEEHRAMFRKWMLQLCLGFNLILYGYGSKKGLLEEFRKTVCSDYHCVVINGFFPSITLKNIIVSICEDCLQLKEIPSDFDEVVLAIDEYLTSNDEALYIFAHNIDGPMLRSSSVQTFLASLSAVENVHLIASIDHVNAPLMWNQSVVTKYKWLWYDATTFDPYIEETSYENSLFTQQSGNLALRSMINVFKSLTPNAKNIFLLLTNYHLEHCADQSYSGIPFQMLYQKCRENFLVNSDQTLRTQLIEFRDHKLIRSRKGADGAEHIFLPADSSTLRDFLQQVESVDQC